MQEKLISYLLGGLDPSEAEALERQLAADAQLAAQLERLRQCVSDADQATDDAADTTPCGLADRTADSVSVLASELMGVEADRSEPGSRRCPLTLLDAGVAVGVVVALGLMLVPALRESREAARRVACQNNLREIGASLQAYAADYGGFFPMVHPDANVGSFTIDLADSQYADRRQLAGLVVCPASSEASEVASGVLTVRIPNWGELQTAEGEALATLRRVMAISYAYRLPYVQNHRFRPIRNEANPRSPLLSDAPTIVAGQWRSLNHGGCGQNVLFQDGSVRYQIDCRVPVMRDHLFVNAAGEPQAPHTWNDAVLVRSEFTPRPTPLRPAWLIGPATRTAE